jgi:hypothetical protein
MYSNKLNEDLIVLNKCFDACFLNFKHNVHVIVCNLLFISICFNEYNSLEHLIFSNSCSISFNCGNNDIYPWGESEIVIEDYCSCSCSSSLMKSVIVSVS